MRYSAENGVLTVWFSEGEEEVESNSGVRSLASIGSKVSSSVPDEAGCWLVLIRCLNVWSGSDWVPQCLESGVDEVGWELVGNWPLDHASRRD